MTNMSFSTFSKPVALLYEAELTRAKLGALKTSKNDMFVIFRLGSQVPSDRDNKRIGRTEKVDRSTPSDRLESTRRSKSTGVDPSAEAFSIYRKIPEILLGNVHRFHLTQVPFIPRLPLPVFPHSLIHYSPLTKRPEIFVKCETSFFVALPPNVCNL